MRIIHGCTPPSEDDFEEECQECECRFEWHEIGWDYAYGDELGYYIEGYEAVCPICGITLDEQKTYNDEEE